ncbi:hypothetical protein Agabi119p4_1411 [Agaricus bisporus var. burnettii]|uniref:Uncharacterized protein n=1 Tax=Agaricus bisporus var. burnettii TaxID=192524 RepID=A0A8H7KKA6_AGABI|nr:hypothetical protein Agabi119p4_1411 [Agaricus bisporus var. burnettii]
MPNLKTNENIASLERRQRCQVDVSGGLRQHGRIWADGERIVIVSGILYSFVLSSARRNFRTNKLVVKPMDLNESTKQILRGRVHMYA